MANLEETSLVSLKKKNNMNRYQKPNKVVIRSTLGYALLCVLCAVRICEARRIGHLEGISGAKRNEVFLRDKASSVSSLRGPRLFFVVSNQDGHPWLASLVHSPVFLQEFGYG